MFLYWLFLWNCMKVLEVKVELTNFTSWANSGRSSHHWIGHKERIPMRMLPVHKAAWNRRKKEGRKKNSIACIVLSDMPGLTLTTQTFFKVRFNIQVIFLILQRLGKQKKKTKSKTWKLWQTAHGLDDCNDCKTISMESRRDGEDYGYNTPTIPLWLQSAFLGEELWICTRRGSQDCRIAEFPKATQSQRQKKT